MQTGQPGGEGPGQWRTAAEQAGLAVAGLEAIIAAALAEDLDGGVDITSTATVAAEQRCVVDLVSRQDGVLAGGFVAAAVFDIVSGGGCAIERPVPDGSRIRAGTVVLSVSGPTRAILTAERTALNLLGHLCGVATLTAAWAEALAGTEARVRDTRKTMPGLRSLQKYAVRCGGGANHRMGLYDQALVKDNHAAAAGGVAAAYLAVRERYPDAAVEVEVDSLEQLREVLAAGAAQVLLDNFGIEELRSAVALTAGRAVLEASGGLTLASAAAVAATGVDFIAVGALTHSAAVLDIGADYRQEA